MPNKLQKLPRLLSKLGRIPTERISVRELLILGFGALIVILAVVVGVSAWQGRQVDSDDSRLHTATETTLALDDARFTVTLANLFLERYVISGDEILVPFIRLNINQTESALAEAYRIEQSQGDSSEYDEAELAALEDIQTQTANFTETAEEVIALQRSADTEAARAVLEAAAPQMTQLGIQLAAAAAAERDELPALRTQAEQTRNLAAWLLLGLGSGGVVIGLAASFVIARSILRPLSTVQSAAQAVARGDLSARARPRGPREIADVGNSVNEMADSLVDALERSEKARARSKESEEKFRKLAETVAAAIFIYQGEQIKYVNSAAEAITGFTRKEWASMKFWDVIHPDFVDLVRQRGPERQRGEDITTRYEIKIVTKSGEERWVDFTAGHLEFEGEPAMLGTAFDITESRHAEKRIAYLAFHDALTNLPNRVLFRDRLSIALAQARRTGHRLAIASVDLDRFKVINDTLGHGAGDDVLKSAAVRLAGSIRQGDTVARVGGDEFIVMLTHCDTKQDGIDTVSRIVDNFRTSFVLEGRHVHVTASAGLSFFPDDGDDLDTLIKGADAAMYRAKQNGRDNVQIYTASMYARTIERLEMESDLRHALQHGELTVHFQPQVSIHSERIVGVEALARWTHPEKGPIPPDEFIPLAEETGIILPLGDFVLRAACSQARTWVESGAEDIGIAVNVSIHQFQQNEFVESVASALDDTGLDPQLLELEITESTAMEDPQVTRKVMEKLSAMGIRITIDDFGTGYSSLEYLHTFPIHRLKIDRSFVRDLPGDAKDAAIAVSVINLAHSLDITVVAEGVETQEQLDFLREQGCDWFQGYLYSRPLPAEELELLMEDSAGSAAQTGEETSLPLSQRA